MSEPNKEKEEGENKHVYITPYIKSLSLEQCQILLQNAVFLCMEDMHSTRFDSTSCAHAAKTYCEKLLKERGILNDLACMLKHCSRHESLIGLYYRIQQEGLWYYYNGYTSISDFDSVGQFLRCYNFLCLRKQGCCPDNQKISEFGRCRQTCAGWQGPAAPR